jgi:hypothetical protein
VRDRGRIGPLAAFFHIGKLIAQRRNAALGEAAATVSIDAWVMPAPAPCANT